MMKAERHCLTSLRGSYCQDSFRNIQTLIKHTVLSAPSVCRRVQESLLLVPQLYAAGQRNTKFNARVLALWLLSAVWHSLVCFYLPVLALSPKAAVDSHGQTVDIWATGTLAYTLAIVVVRPDDADISNRLSKFHMYAGGVLTLASSHPPVLAMCWRCRRRFIDLL